MAKAPKIPAIFAEAMEEVGTVFDGADLRPEERIEVRTTITDIFKAWAKVVPDLVAEATSQPVEISITELARRSGVGQDVLLGRYGAVRNFTRYFAYFLTSFNNCPAKSHGEFDITVDVRKAADPGVLF